MRKNRSIVLGVTHARSLGLISGIAAKLHEAKWQVHVVSAAGTQTASLSDYADIHTIPMIREPSPWRDFRGLVNWVHLVRAIKPDLVLIGTPKAGFLGAISAWLARVPVRVYHLRGLRLESANGVMRKVLWSIEKLTFQLSTHSIAVSESLAALAIDDGLVPPHKIKVLGEGSSKGVDVNRFRPGSPEPSLRDHLELIPGVPIIGFVGRLTRDKGSYELFEASQKLSQQGTDHQLLVIGDEDEDLIITQLADVKLSRQPVLTGRVEDTAPYYQLMDVLCLPTHREGFPNVVLEAGASGVPTVTTDATGAIDSVIDNYSGIIVPKGSPVQLASALSALLSCDARRQEMGKNAREYVSAHFSSTRVNENLFEYLEHLVETEERHK